MIHKGSNILLLFFAYNFLVSSIYGNWIGFVIGLGIMFLFILGLFIRSVMTSELFEKVLNLICRLSVIASIYAVIEKYILPLLNEESVDRASAMFFYPNYFGTIASIVVIVCAYKVITRQGNRWSFYGIAGMNLISIYLSGSMFAWVEVFLGVSVLLFAFKRHKLLAYWLLFVTAAGFMIVVLRMDVIPRLSQAEVTTEMRIDIWEFAIRQIKRRPLFGHGFMSYLFLDKTQRLGYLVPHSHSIILELLLNFGIVGTSMFLWYFIRYYASVIRAYLIDKSLKINYLILAVTAAAFIHGVVDLTLMWIQTLPLFLIILSGAGAFENSVVIPQTKRYNNKIRGSINVAYMKKDILRKI
ncbi:MAG: O-antigen ligase family protein [Lachnospiraceae bacterium]|nr:O-antigen ligase family protein [Lachnospiraceae bacterium]